MNGTSVIRYVLAGVVLIFVVVVGFYVAMTARTPGYTTALVHRGAVTQEVLASGNVASPDSIDLQFQNSGKLVALNVASGDKVSKGDLLAQLDTSVIGAQRQQAVSALDAQKAQLQSLEAGTRPEQLAVTEAQVTSDVTALAQAEKGVEDAIKNAYNVSDSAVKNNVDTILDNALTSPHLKFQVSNQDFELAVENGRSDAGLKLATWMQGLNTFVAQGNIAGAEDAAQVNIQTVSKLLADANAALSAGVPSGSVTSAQISAWMTTIATARSSINSAISTLSAATTARKNTAAALEHDQKNLALEYAGSTNTSINAQQAQVEAAQANLAAIDAQIAQMRLVAPTTGLITKVDGETGETVAPSRVVVSMIPDSKLQVDVNLSEDNVANVAVGQSARIKLDAFGSDLRWQGTVQKIDPAETVIGGAIYYKTTVVFDTPDERVKSGMTADVWIQTGSSNNSLLVPASAILKNGNATTVQVLENGSRVVRQVTTGLKGADGNVEILSGVSEGESVVTGE